MLDRVPRPFEARILRVYYIYLRNLMAKYLGADYGAELSGTAPMVLYPQKLRSMFILTSVQTIDLR